ncbi:MAG: exodeoxyribonuclease III [Sedimentisphaeraceae bacterium JB056]
MKIATFNANSIRSRMQIIKDWLSENEPDVLCIQETKVQDKDFPLDDIKETGYEVVFKGQKSYNGVATLSRLPIDDFEYGLDDEPRDEPRIINTKINGINIINTYIPQGNSIDSDKFPYKLQWYARLKKYFEKRFKPTDPVVWLGDMNVAPEDIDVHNPKGLLGHVCFRQEVWDAFKDVKDFGFTDILRKHHPEEQIFTFWDYRGGSYQNNRGWRIDHILVTKPLADKSTRCYVDKKPREKEKPSDHTFFVAEFDI